MTARDATGFYAFFSTCKFVQIFSTFCGDFLTKLHRKPGERGNNPLEKNEKNPVETAPRNCRILSLVVVERVLNTIPARDVAKTFGVTIAFVIPFVIIAKLKSGQRSSL